MHGEEGEEVESGRPVEDGTSEAAAVGDDAPGGAEIWTLDRFEADLGVLVSDDGRIVEIERRRLPEEVRPGTVLLIAGAAGAEAIEVSEELTERRRSEAREILDELKRRDPGGDISIGG